MKWLKKLLVIILIIIVLYFCLCGAAAYFQVGTMGEGLLAFGFSSTGMNFVVAGLALAGAYMISPTDASRVVGRITDGLSDFAGKIVSGAGKVAKSGLRAIFDIVAPYIPLCLGGYIIYKALFDEQQKKEIIEYRPTERIYSSTTSSNKISQQESDSNQRNNRRVNVIDNSNGDISGE